MHCSKNGSLQINAGRLSHHVFLKTAHTFCILTLQGGTRYIFGSHLMLLTSQLFVQSLQRCPQLHELYAALVAALLGEAGHVGVELEVHGVADNHGEHHREQDHDEREHEHPQVIVLQVDSGIALSDNISYSRIEIMPGSTHK